MIFNTPVLFGSTAERAALCRAAEQHVARALMMMGRARALVADERVDAIELLNGRRTALGEHFARYQRLKHGSIFDPVVEHGPASSKVVARTMKIDCMELGELFGAYHARWSRVRARDWCAYRSDMIATVDTMSTHLSAELRAIRQLLMISDLYGEG